MTHTDLPNEVDLHDLTDTTRPEVRYLGRAKRQPNGRYRCLAVVAGALCVVEAKVSSVTPAR